MTPDQLTEALMHIEQTCEALHPATELVMTNGDQPTRESYVNASRHLAALYAMLKGVSEQ